MEHLKDTWAIVVTGNGKYIGHLIHSYMNDGEEINKWVSISPVYEIILNRKDTVVRNIGLNTHNMEIKVKPIEIWFLDDMNMKDKERYEDLIHMAKLKTTI